MATTAAAPESLPASNRPVGTKAARKQEDSQNTNRVGNATNKALGGPGTDSLSVVLGNGAAGPLKAVLLDTEVTFGPFALSQMDGIAEHLQTVPVILTALAITDISLPLEEADAARVAVMMGHLRGIDGWNSDMVRVGFASLSFQIPPAAIRAMGEVVLAALWRHHSDKIKSGEWNLAWVLERLNIPEFPQILRYIYKTNVGIYERFVQGFEALPLPESAMLSSEQLESLIAEGEEEPLTETEPEEMELESEIHEEESED